MEKNAFKLSMADSIFHGQGNTARNAFNTAWQVLAPQQQGFFLKLVHK